MILDAVLEVIFEVLLGHAQRGYVKWGRALSCSKVLRISEVNFSKTATEARFANICYGS